MKIGLALSGGAARGIAHLGVIKALEENDIETTMISGASAGAIIGAFYAKGYKPDEILEIFTKIKINKYLSWTFRNGGVMKLDQARPILKENLEIDDFSGLKLPLHIVATNLRSGKPRFFNKGPLFDAILASSVIPGLFSPIKIDGDEYIDGGVVNNLPTEPLMGNCEKIIGSHCNPFSENFKSDGIKSIIERALILSVTMNIQFRKSLCDLFIEPPEMANYSIFDTSKMQDMYQVSYDFASRLLESAGLSKLVLAD